MKVFEEIFRKNRQAALKNRQREVDVTIEYINKTAAASIVQEEEMNQKFQEGTVGEIMLAGRSEQKQVPLDAESISEYFERDARRYSAIFDSSRK